MDSPLGPLMLFTIPLSLSYWLYMQWKCDYSDHHFCEPPEPIVVTLLLCCQKLSDFSNKDTWRAPWIGCLKNSSQENSRFRLQEKLKTSPSLWSHYDLRKMFLKLKYPAKLIDSIFKRFHASQDQNQSCTKAVDSAVLIAELQRARRASEAPWVRKTGNPSSRENLVMTSAYERPSERPYRLGGRGRGVSR